MTDQDKANCDAYFAELDAKMAKMTAQDKADSDAYFAKLDAQVTKINPQDKAACDAYSKTCARMHWKKNHRNEAWKRRKHKEAAAKAGPAKAAHRLKPTCTSTTTFLPRSHLCHLSP
jgi:hypothetical protein